MGSSHLTALLLAGQPLPMIGRLLVDRQANGTEVAVDPTTAQQVRRSDATWVLSDEGEATDGHVLRQEWDFKRANAGIPIMYDHGQESSPMGSFPVGRWTDLRIAQPGEVPDTVGRALLARAVWAQGIHEAERMRSLVDQDILRAVSVRWLPGLQVRRSELDPSDPLWRAPAEDDCGFPAEGFVMGSPDQPNELVEASLTPTPAQPRAYARRRLDAGAERAVQALGRGGEPTPSDFSRLLARLSADARVRAWILRQLRVLVDERLPTPLKTAPATLGDLFGSNTP